jgi:hypothetical protein
MVRLEDGTQISMSQALTGECAVCGKRLTFKKETINEVESEVARHCGKIYSISQSQLTSVSMSQDPEYKKKEDELIQNQGRAKQLRRDGKTEEAAKLDEQNRQAYDKLLQEREPQGQGEEAKLQSQRAEGREEEREEQTRLTRGRR